MPSNTVSKMPPELINLQGQILFHGNIRSPLVRMRLLKLADLGYEAFPIYLIFLISRPTDETFVLASGHCFEPKNIPFHERSRINILRFLVIKSFEILSCRHK